VFGRNGAGRMGGSQGLRVGGALAAIAVGILVVIGTVGVPGATARVTGTGTAGGSGSVVAYHVSPAAQRAALAYWTPARMAAAQAQARPQPAELPNATPPKGIPTPVQFTGVPTVGALFATGGKAHFCTASVVDSTAGDLVLAAAHCVFGKNGPSTNIAFVPGSHWYLQEPYGEWAVQTIYVAPGWASNHNPNLDFAFLAVAPLKGRNIQAVTGGLRVGFLLGYLQTIEVIGYNNTDKNPIKCKTKSFKFQTNQMEFYCNDYRDGTSGGPWIIDYNAKNGTGTVFGVIGGYEQGGDYPWASYSAYFGVETRSVMEAAEKAQSTS
jgi:hypothetical protein